jgi:type IV pilus assembly protein PilV
MKRNMQAQSRQGGMILIEALMAILVFSLGILGLVGVNALAAGTQSDAQYRNEANRLAERIINEMWVNVDRSNEATLAASVDSFEHRAAVGACDAAAAGTASANPLITDWVATIAAGGMGGLPGSTNQMQQVSVNPPPGTAGDKQVTVTVCWRAPSDIAVRRHVVTTYITR